MSVLSFLKTAENTVGNAAKDVGHAANTGFNFLSNVVTQKNPTVNRVLSGTNGSSIHDQLQAQLNRTPQNSPDVPTLKSAVTASATPKPNPGVQIANEAKNVAVAGTRGILRTGFGIGVSVGQAHIPGNPDTLNVTNPIAQKILGKEPIESYQKRFQGATTAAKKAGLGAASVPLAFLGQVANAGLDVSGLGGAEDKTAKTLVEDLAKETTSSGVANLLKGKIAPEVIDKVSGAIAKTKDPNVIRNIIKGSSDIPVRPQVTIPAVDKTAQTVGKDVAAVKKEVPSPHPLEQIKTYSGGNSGFSTPNKDFAASFADKTNNGKIAERTINQTDVLDTRVPAQRAQLESVLGKDKVDELISRGDTGLPAHGAAGSSAQAKIEQDSLIQAAKDLGYKHVALSETDKATKFQGKDVISYADTAASQRPITNPDLKAALENATKKTSVKISPNAEDKVGKTAADIRTSYSGEKNRAILAGQQLGDAVHKAAPGEEKGIFWYNEAGGSADKLQGWLAKAGEKDSPLAPHAQDIQQALNLSPQGKEAAAALTQYYKAAGQNAAEQGTIKGVLHDYGNNRLYEQEKATAGVTGDLLKQTTGHAKSRVYDTVADAILNGKKPLTTDAADLAAIHSGELARVNTTRNLLDNLDKTKLGQWVDTSKERIPTGFAQVGELRKGGTQVFTAPEALAKKLRPITEPDFVRRVDGWRKIQAYQGLVKTVDLSYSLFHHITEASQFLYQTKFGLDIARNAGKILHTLDSPEFAQMEQNFAKSGGITSKVEGLQDIVRGLGDHSATGLVGKFKDLPVVKQALGVSDKSSEFLFDKAQRYLKVTDFYAKSSKWLSKHPNATPEEFRAATQGYAKEINAAYGGLNWESIGVTKTTQSVLRGVLLAPDWVVSNLALAKYGLGKGTAGASARAHLFTALLSGTVATQMLNYSINGHFTNENPKGHEFDVQLAPNVYVSLYRGGIGDILKLAGNIQDSGVAQGTARFAQGKLSPVARTAVGLLSGTQFTGQPISNKTDSFAKKSVNEAKYIGQSLLPLPFGVVSTAKYVNEAKKTGQPVNPYVAASLASGVSRFSKTNNALSSKENATISQLAKNGAPKDQQKAYEQFYLTSKSTSKDRTAANKAIDKALSQGDTQQASQVAQAYNDKYATAFTNWAKKYDQYTGDKALLKDYNSNKINLTTGSIKARVKAIKTNPLYAATTGQ